jgi:misacylated tRNA(Ala) deacylase
MPHPVASLEILIGLYGRTARPLREQGRIRFVLIENGSVDSQPCGGTHIANVSEIDRVPISKIAKKGRENRRFRIRSGNFEEQET